MEKMLDADKAIDILVSTWANQYGVTVTRRGSNEEVNNSTNNSGNSI